MQELDGVVPFNRTRRWALPLLTVAGLGGAGGAGYYAKQLRGERNALRRAEVQLRAENQTLQRQRSSLTEHLTQRTKERDAAAQSHTGAANQLRETSAELAVCQASVKDLAQQRATAKALTRQFDALTRQFQKMIDSGKLEVEFRRGQMVVKLPDRVLFPSGSADLSENGKATLSSVAKVLRPMRRRQFTVAGHTDNVPVRSGKFSNNWELSTARAVTVTTMLIARGVRSSSLVAAGHGQHAPIANNRTPAGRKRNRRIEIILEPDLQRLRVGKVAANKPRHSAHTQTARAMR